ncbi:MAG: hypothetical protein H6672_22250 [Anaerolineaceae bacterium]|nr:hypothetical protein [Anaerolineaceae bacterium]
MMRNRKQTGLVVLGVLGLTFGCAFICGMQLMLCQTPILDEISLPPSISTFVGTRDYTITDLVMTAQSQVQEQLSFLDEADSEFVSASYTCQNSECSLLEAQVKVFIRRKMGCYFGGSSFSSDDPFASSVTNISFDIPHDRLSAVTQLRDDHRRNLVSWEELPLSIDEIIQVAFAVEGDQYAREHPEFELGVTLLGDRWAVVFSLDAAAPPDIRLHIDYNGNLIAG